MRYRTPILIAGLTSAAIAISFAFAPALVVNGKATANGVLVSKGKTYVSLDALKAGGAQVTASASKVTINFQPLAGREQVDAVEGKLGYFLQNDLWRVKVESVEDGSNPFGRGPGFVAKIEFRNLSKRAISPYVSSMDKIQIIDDKQQVFNFSQSTFKQFFKDVAPGGSVTETIAFGSEQATISEVGKPEKMMIFFRSSGGKKTKDLRIFLTPADQG